MDEVRLHVGNPEESFVIHRETMGSEDDGGRYEIHYRTGYIELLQGLVRVVPGEPDITRIVSDVEDVSGYSVELQINFNAVTERVFDSAAYVLVLTCQIEVLSEVGHSHRRWDAAPSTELDSAKVVSGRSVVHPWDSSGNRFAVIDEQCVVPAGQSVRIVGR